MGTTPDAAAITQWLAGWRDGDLAARDQLFAVVHPELRQLAARSAAAGTAGSHTGAQRRYQRGLPAPHRQPALSYSDRAHFFAVAAQTMRRVLVDYARARVAEKRGAGLRRVPLSDAGEWEAAISCEQLIDLDTELAGLAAADARAARVVELRFFGGLLEEEVAASARRVGHHDQARLESRSRLAGGAAAVVGCRVGDTRRAPFPLYGTRSVSDANDLSAWPFVCRL